MSLKLDRRIFWQRYHKSFDAHGPTTQKTVDALNAILDKFESETRLKYRSWYAYCLATAYHETGIGGNHFVPVKEGKAGSRTKIWRENQSKYWDTGFYGRGLVQITWEDNYRKFGERLGLGHKFVDDPDLMLDIKWAYEAMVIGMVEGMYRADRKTKRRKSLALYLRSDDATVQEYINARDIINGDIKKNGLLIANYAEKFENILLLSEVVDDGKSGTAGSVPAVVDEPAPSADDSLLSIEQPPTANEKVTETQREVTDGHGNTETTNETMTESFVPKNIPAFIPRFGKQWFLSIIPGGGILTTMLSYLAGLPPWVVLLFGVLAGVTLVLFAQLIIRHRKGVQDFIIRCYESMANPTENNLIPTPPPTATLFTNGERRNQLLSILEPDAAKE